MKLHFQEFGSGPTLVLLHGLFGSADNWRLVALPLAEHFRVLVPDQRNHGASPSADYMDYPTLAADLAAWLDMLGLSAIHLVGHSMGGKTAMQFALHYPGRVHRLLVVDMAPRAYPPHHEDILSALRAVNLEHHTTRPAIEAALAPAIPNLTLRRFLLKNLGRNEQNQLAWKINLAALQTNYPHLCAPLDPAATARPFLGPTLFLRGGRSDYVRRTDEPEIRRLFPNTRLVTVPEAGHWLPADAPEEFIHHAREFFGMPTPTNLESGS